MHDALKNFSPIGLGQQFRAGLYREGLAAFGERGMVELVGIIGYYTFVAMILNAFEMRI